MAGLGSELLFIAVESNAATHSTRLTLLYAKKTPRIHTLLGVRGFHSLAFSCKSLGYAIKKFVKNYVAAILGHLIFRVTSSYVICFSAM